MSGLVSRAEAKANVERIVAQAITDYDRKHGPAHYWLWPVRMVGAAVRSCVFAFVGVFVELWRRVRG